MPILARAARPGPSGPPAGAPAPPFSSPWEATARRHALALTRTVHTMGVALEAGRGTGPDPGPWARTSGCAPAVVAACGVVADWLAANPPPPHARWSEAELAAAVGVYRNAAFACRRLVEADPRRRILRSEAGLSLLHQGDEHIARFLDHVGERRRPADGVRPLRRPFLGRAPEAGGAPR